MKKLLLSIVSLMVLLVISGCTKDNSTERDLLNNTQDVFGFEAMTSINLLDSMDSNTQTQISYSQDDYTISSLGFTSDVSEEEIDEINKYLGIMEQMLAEGDPINVVEETSDKVEYENKMVISTKDLNLNTYTYILYFNEVSLNEELDEEESEDVEENDDEIESTLEGIMLVGDKEYVVTGKKELEEDEMKVEFTSKIDDENWVKVTQKTENEESKFEYSISENGIITKTEIKFETEENETMMKLKFIDGDNKSEYKFKTEVEDDKQLIKIDIKDESRTLQVKVFLVVDSVTGEVTYEYRVKDSNKTFNKERNNPQDDEEDNDEEVEQNQTSL